MRLIDKPLTPKQKQLEARVLRKVRNGEPITISEERQAWARFLRRNRGNI